MAVGKMASSSAATTSGGQRSRPIILDSEDDEPPKTTAKKAPPPKTALKKRKVEEDSESEDNLPDPPSKAKNKGKSRASAVKPTRRTIEDDDFLDDEDDDFAPKKKSVAQKKTVPKKTKVTHDDDDDDLVETKPKPKPKPKWVPGVRAGPAAPGSKNIPEGAPDCLAGLTFVFTGELASLGRDEAQDLVKRYSGRVTTAPSSKTSYVVLGTDAGPKKLESIKKHGIKTLDEDEFLGLIASRGPDELDEKVIKKRKEEQKQVIENAKRLAPPKASVEGKTVDQNQLWTVKYAPTAIKDVCGNKGLVEKLQGWLKDWDKNRIASFKKPGKDGLGLYRCVVLSGPPGIGKTTSAHLVAQLEGYDVIELNASDTRSKKLFESAMKDASLNTSIMGYVGTNAGNDNSEKLLLIMDEVDGMSAGDRGGVGALSALIKKTSIPIIAIANDMSLPKMKPLKASAHNLTFRRPDTSQIRSRIMSICHREGLKVTANAIDQLIQGNQQDIRQVLNMLSTFRLGGDAGMSLSFDDSKDMLKGNDKNILNSPWTLCQKLFSPYMFSTVNPVSLNAKTDLYFADHDLLPLFVQDNYLKHKFSLSTSLSGKQRELKDIQLVSKAADAITHGDLVDRLIHGPQQHWSLMPLHGVFSCVKPSFYCHGSFDSSVGGNTGWGMSFPTWFGKNSTQNKLSRLLGEVSIRMRLRVSGDRMEIRQHYLPTLRKPLLDPLTSNKMELSESIDQVIKLMDEYYLTKEEWDSIMEIVSIGSNWEENLKKIPTQTKTNFTRTYNKQSHPIPFHKATEINPKSMKKLSNDAAPDHEDVIEEEIEISSSDNDSSGREDTSKAIGKDKLIKAKVKSKKAATKSTAAKATKSKVGKGTK